GMGSITASPVIADVNGDGAPEVLVAARGLGLLDRHGRDLYGWPRRIGGPIASTPAIAKVPGNGTVIYVGSDDDRLYALSFEGKPQAGFPFQTSGDIFSSPLLMDLNHDGVDEVVFGSDDGCVHAIDRQGRPVPGWPFRTGGFVSASPVPVATKGDAMVAVGSWDGELYLIDPDGHDLPGWPRPAGFPVWGSAAVADIDGDGVPEIMAAAQELHAFRVDGSPLDGFPVPLGGYAVASPAVGDIDGDGNLEVVVCSDRIYAFRADGQSVEGFPVDTDAYFWASPVLVDVDGDGHPEIVAGDFKGRLWAIGRRGAVLRGYPRQIGRKITAAPAAVDIDGDSFLELVVATADGRVIAMPTECPDDAASAPWPTFLHGRNNVTGAHAGHRLRRKEGIQGARRRGPRSPAEAPVILSKAKLLDRTDSSRMGSQSDTDRIFDVRLRPGLPAPFSPIEILLEGLDGVRHRGMLYYTVDGRVHPSPLLREGDGYFALVQPLPPLKRIKFNFKVRADAGEFRVPAEGDFTFRVGIPGIRMERGHC
ncbi:MAG: PQQ-binding-like beta-propeller repeat protein, partial [Chloroflexi bacterium]|nr:PQQ-binding-like beta-propeller repeat protein [Chloroflexota bacterium]